jgi:transmembrane sensor
LIVARIHPASASEIPATPEDGAAYWFARRNATDLTRLDREQRDIWLGDPANRLAYERASMLWGELDTLAAHEQMRHLRQEALDARPAVRQVPMRWLMAAAAGIAAIVASGYLVRSFDQPVQRQRVTAESAEHDSGTRYQTAVGERSTVTLKDGSSVTLNTASELLVQFTAAERVVELARGQAYFAVAKDQRHPFVVLAGGRRITALGTAFDVRLDRDLVQVVLVEGRVAVNPVAVPKNRIELEPGERFISKDDTTGSVSAANVATSTSWRGGRVVFNATPLADAIAEVNRYRDRPITLGDAAIAGLKISGTYRISEVDRFPQALASYYPLEVAARPSGEAVLLWRQLRSGRSAIDFQK